MRVLWIVVLVAAVAAAAVVGVKAAPNVANGYLKTAPNVGTGYYKQIGADASTSDVVGYVGRYGGHEMILVRRFPGSFVVIAAAESERGLNLLAMYNSGWYIVKETFHVSNEAFNNPANWTP